MIQTSHAPVTKSAPESSVSIYGSEQIWQWLNLNVHDVVVDKGKNILFINTDFSCLATIEPGYSFAPVWTPPFITKLAAEYKCHLNGLAMVEGQPTYVTACSSTDDAAGWRDRRVDGGVAIGKLFAAESEFTAAISADRSALKINPTAIEIALELGQIDRSQALIQESIDCYRRAIHTQPQSAPAYNCLGSVLFDRGDIKTAEAAYRRALSFDPHYDLAHRNLAFLLAQTEG